MARPSPEDIARLSVAERVQLAEDIWNSIAADPGSLPLTEAQKLALDRRRTQAVSLPIQLTPEAEADGGRSFTHAATRARGSGGGPASAASPWGVMIQSFLCVCLLALATSCYSPDRLERREAEEIAVAALKRRCEEVKIPCDSAQAVRGEYDQDGMWVFQFSVGSDREMVAGVLVDGFGRAEVHIGQVTR